MVSLQSTVVSLFVLQIYEQVNENARAETAYVRQGEYGLDQDMESGSGLQTGKQPTIAVNNIRKI